MPDPPDRIDEEAFDVIPFPDRNRSDPATAESPSDESFVDPVAMDPADLIDSPSFPMDPRSEIDRPENPAAPPGEEGVPTTAQDEGPAVDDELIEGELESPNPDLAAGKRVALVGRFGSMNRREAANVLQSFQATVVDLPLRKIRNRSAEAEEPSGERASVSLPEVDWVIIGAEQPLLSQSELLPSMLIEAAGRGELEILQETDLWQRLGLVDVEQSVRRFYTPVMLADLLGVSVRIIRRWHRRGLIKPVVTLHKLPYFDYAEVATAKRLAGWIIDGASARTIEQRLVELIEVLPNIRRPLDQLSILVEGKHVLLRQGDGLIEPGGQMRFDFDAADSHSFASADEEDLHGNDSPDAGPRPIVAFPPPGEPPMLRTVGHGNEDPILEAAYEAEDEDDLETAVELYHTILARDGASPEINFQIGELLYRMNHLVAARERFYGAIELDPEFVEARASLGGVLAELGQFDLAVAALRGTLTMFDDYADVHYTLAKTLDQMGHDVEALPHWKRILELAPDSPWAAEGAERLGVDS